MDSKLWDIFDGLKLVLDRGIDRVLIQTNSLEAVNTIQEGISEDSNSALVRIIHALLKLLKQWSIQHIPREENKLADEIVK
ncbi:hypothetical protein Godav_012709, partial [Gossypium davidsonii]|nr:hypothetical protein [Gossypium davidsonii]MBA0647186.1 hypothetical protein [Gossypium klotzschianum]